MTKKWTFGHFLQVGCGSLPSQDSSDNPVSYMFFFWDSERKTHHLPRLHHGRGNLHPQEKRGKCQPELRRFMQSFWVPAWQRPVQYMQRPACRLFTLIFGVCLMGKNWHKICTRKIPNKISEKCIASKFASWKFAFLWKYVTPFSTNRLVVATQIALTLHPFCLGGNHPRWLAHLFQTGWLKPPSLGFINSVPAISKLEGWRTSGFGRNQGVFGAMVTV